MSDLHNIFIHFLIKVQKKYAFVQHSTKHNHYITETLPSLRKARCIASQPHSAPIPAPADSLNLITQSQRTDLSLHRTAGRGNHPVRLPILYQPRSRYPDHLLLHHKCIRIHHRHIFSFCCTSCFIIGNYPAVYFRILKEGSLPETNHIILPPNFQRRGSILKRVCPFPPVRPVPAAYFPGAPVRRLSEF